MLLMHLDQSAGGKLRRVDLAERLDLSQSSVTRMVAPMEKIGLVERADDPRDARVAYVVLTRAGRRLAREGTTTLGEMASSLFADRWTDQELKTLGDLLGRLTAALPGQLQRADRAEAMNEPPMGRERCRDTTWSDTALNGSAGCARPF